MKRFALAICLLACVACYGKVVLVLQSWPRDPDLPQNLPDTSLPSNWNASADHTPTNNAQLQELLDGDASGDVAAGEVIELDADVDYGTIIVDASVQGDADNWIIIRTDEYASLPAYGLTSKDNRAVEADATYMATISRVPTGDNQPALTLEGGSSAPGVSYVRFIGIQFESTGTYASDDYLSVIACLTSGSAIPHDSLPEHIGFDRCIVTVDDDINPKDTVRLDANDSFVVGCCFHNLWGGSEDGSTSIRSYRMQRCLIQNNSFESMGAALFLHDNSGTGQTITDVKYSHNYHCRLAAWDDGGTGNHETYGNNKASWESKGGSRIEISNSVFDYHFNPTFGAITIKSESSSPTRVAEHFTVRGVKILNSREGLNVFAGGSGGQAGVGPNHDILIEDALVGPSPSKSIEIQVYDTESAGPLERFQVRNCTLSGTADVYTPNPGTSTGFNHIWRDNILLNAQYGYNVNSGQQGAWAFNWGWGSTYVATHNLWVGKSISSYDSDSDPAPLGTLTDSSFPADNTAVGFTDYAGGDYSIDNGSDYATSSSTGGKPGYDAATYDPIWAEVTP